MMVTKSQRTTSELSSRSVSKKCLVADCDRKAQFRGCCVPCLAVFRRAVKAKTTTWKKLISAGLVLESRPGKRTAATDEIDRMNNRSKQH